MAEPKAKTDSKQQTTAETSQKSPEQGAAQSTGPKKLEMTSVSGDGKQASNPTPGQAAKSGAATHGTKPVAAGHPASSSSAHPKTAGGSPVKGSIPARKTGAVSSQPTAAIPLGSMPSTTPMAMAGESTAEETPGEGTVTEEEVKVVEKEGKLKPIVAGRKARLSVKHMVQIVLLSLLLFTLGSFVFFAYRFFSQDKKLFTLELNMAITRAVTAEVNLDVLSRLVNMQLLIERVHRGWKDGPLLYEGALPGLRDELLSFTVYERYQPDNPDEPRKVRVYLHYENEYLKAKHGFPPEILGEMNAMYPLPIDAFFEKQGLDLYNRSVEKMIKESWVSSAFVTFLFTGRQALVYKTEYVVVADFLQDFLRKRLKGSEFAELFLFKNNGNLMTHRDAATTIKYAKEPYPHPAVRRFTGEVLPKESLEFELNGKQYLGALNDVGLGNLFVVSQMDRKHVFQALVALIIKTVLLGLLVMVFALVLSVIALSTLENTIAGTISDLVKKIKTGQVNIHSKKSVQQAVAESLKARVALGRAKAAAEGVVPEDVDPFFMKMADQLGDVVEKTAEQARMENELKTMQLVQSTLLTTPHIKTDSVEIAHHLVSASETGGDFWDAYLSGSKLTLILGDATGHGAPAALVTAVAKSCFATLNSVYAEQPLLPEQFLDILNRTIVDTCKGQLLMTMVVMQLDLDVGRLLVCNAGHEAPICLRTKKLTGTTGPTQATPSATEILFTRGERLGYNPASTFRSQIYQLDAGDIVLLYTDGITEAENAQGQAWGERRLLKTLSGTGKPRGVNQIKNEIVSAVNNHMTGAMQKDDLTLVLVSWIKKAAGKGRVWTPPTDTTPSETPKKEAA